MGGKWLYGRNWILARAAGAQAGPDIEGAPLEIARRVQSHA